MQLKDFVSFGISPSMLFPGSFDDELTHYKAVELCCHLPEFERFETFLPHSERLRRAEINDMARHHKKLNYNIPGYFQLDNEFNPCSDTASIRANALASMKEQIDFAAEAGSSIVEMTGSVDKGPERREELLDRFFEYFMEVSLYAEKYGILTAIEPIERSRFKRLFLGPTSECAEFIKKAREAGAGNARLMLDFAHLPLMEEQADEAVRISSETGLAVVHMAMLFWNLPASFTAIPIPHRRAERHVRYGGTHLSF
ncbi:TIM barrel protein [Clostridium sp. AM58-1XD]|uniref:sugar phosphate isomerase/epimerase family protein n=1 Tax=Clostridium sp. AM58-1XD TaxID=2292307 RepID=UPI001FA81B00|nr:TIM barrel protein [Clostridium sp. AM58-1XD]